MSLDMLTWTIVYHALWSVVAALLFAAIIVGVWMLAWGWAANLVQHRENEGPYGYSLYRAVVGSTLTGRIVPERRHRRMPQYLRTYAAHGRAHRGTSGYA